MKNRIVFSAFLMIVLSVLANAQKEKKISVSGYVIDTVTYTPVAGAKIIVDNKETNVTTDNNGHYLIRLKPGAVTIGVLVKNRLFSEIINGRTDINFPVTLNENRRIPGSGNEVDMGISSVDRERSAVAISKGDVIETKDEDVSRYQDIYEMIRGKVPGVDVNGEKIRIRGINTLLGNNDPLLIVDGVVVSSISHIVPQRVKSITVLKGTAAAIYGSRAANGVVVITLKSNPANIK